MTKLNHIDAPSRSFLISYLMHRSQSKIRAGVLFEMKKHQNPNMCLFYPSPWSFLLTVKYESHKASFLSQLTLTLDWKMGAVRDVRAPGLIKFCSWLKKCCCMQDLIGVSSEQLRHFWNIDAGSCCVLCIEKTANKEEQHLPQSTVITILNEFLMLLNIRNLLFNDFLFNADANTEAHPVPDLVPPHNVATGKNLRPWSI
ncbi:hypothetical protein CEXT_100031 [Caerostris extrusa]|uniref:Uncharacterized protein n=1 Tax=Caerostris extrusa TaxID=172846 RepID=A0AAV4YFF5_CAEEX|nr:hypothetical protein CEXT_100031 [Caerostris extrusa]